MCQINTQSIFEFNTQNQFLTLNTPYTHPQSIIYSLYPNPQPNDSV